MILRKTLIALLVVLIGFVYSIPVQAAEIHKAAKDGDLAKVKSLLEKDAKRLDAGNRLQQTPLIMAAWGGHKEMVTFLLEKGAAVNHKDSFGATPLHMAVVQGHKEIVELLILKGADINATAKNGKIPLQLAFEKEHTAIIQLLLNQGIDIKTPVNEYGRTLLHKAVIMGKQKVVDLLIAKGADINTKDKTGKSPLDFALICGHKGLAKLLMEKGAKTAIKPTLEVTYIANAGFLVSANDQKEKILIDALFRTGFGMYPVPAKAVLEDIEKANAPFDNIDLLMVTHKNAAHFDPVLTENYLAKNPNVPLVSSREVGLEMELFSNQFQKIKQQVMAITPSANSSAAVTVNGIKIKILRLRHHQGLQNLGFIVTLGAKTVFHPGDGPIKFNVENFKNFKLNDEGIDVAFILYWDFQDADARALIKTHIQPKHIILMHAHPNEIDKISQEIEKQKKNFPNVTIFKKSLEKKVFN